jgi:hypothetical protein
MIETVTTCPLGAKCVEIKENKIHRCAWLVTLAGRDSNTGQDINEENCAIAWQPLLMLEIANKSRGTTQAVESLRDEVAGVARPTEQQLLLD